MLARILLLNALLLTAIPALAQDSGREAADVEFRWGMEIPMRDGVDLNATVYLPGDHQQPLPAIITITPYISDRYHPDALFFARHGFAFVIVDTRGRGNSGGKFEPMRPQDGIDGHDIVEWVAQQPWSNGKVALRGGSYGGYNQWATARHFPEHLVTIVPIAAAFPGIDFPMNYNVAYPYAIRWATLTSGRTPNNNTFGDEQFWERIFLQYHQQGIAFTELGELAGNTSTAFAEWQRHPRLDDWYLAASPSAGEYQRLNLPILTITGYYDGDQPGAMEYYRRHMQHGSEAAKARHFLILGPWNHSGTRKPVQEFGGYKFGDKMMFEPFELDREWYRWTMSDGERPAMIMDRVTYFVAGNNEWKSAPSLDAVSDRELTLYLGSARKRHLLFHSGTLSGNKKSGENYSEYVYDPLDTGKAERGTAEDYITDQSEVTHTDGDGLIFHSEPFREATEITGYIRLEAWLAMDVPDTDINVTLYEIAAGGGSMALTGETLRARYRQSLMQSKLIEAGKINRFSFKRFYFFSRLIAKGSRLRLFIRPANSLDQQRNYNSGKPVRFETKDDARTATVKLYHSGQYPSRLILPVVSN